MRVLPPSLHCGWAVVSLPGQRANSNLDFQLTRRISYGSEFRVRSVRLHAPYRVAEAVDLIFLMVLPYVPV